MTAFTSGAGAVLPLRLAEGRELLIGRQLAVPEQIGDRLEGLGLCELLHGISAVEQAVGLGVHLADRCAVSDDAGQTLLDVFGHAHSFVIWKLKIPESNWLYDS